jgi:hypothetical protein
MGVSEYARRESKAMRNFHFFILTELPFRVLLLFYPEVDIAKFIVVPAE